MYVGVHPFTAEPQSDEDHWISYSKYHQGSPLVLLVNHWRGGCMRRVVDNESALLPVAHWWTTLVLLSDQCQTFVEFIGHRG